MATKGGKRPGGAAGGRAGGGKGGGAVAGRSGARELSVRVKTAKGRKLSSTRWLQRQLNDPYVAAAQREGYRSRAAFKLAEIDDKMGILRPGARVVDLGAAPGGWSQVAAARCVQAGRGRSAGGRVVALDLQEIEPLPDVEILKADMHDRAAETALLETLNGHADVVLSDMAAPSTGHAPTDHLRIVGLCELALDFADKVLAPGGAFVAKVLKGGTERELLLRLKRDFETVKHVKPPASRTDSAEEYVVATGFRGAGRTEDA